MRDRTARHGARGERRVKQNCGHRWDGGRVSAENPRNDYVFSKVIGGVFTPGNSTWSPEFEIFPVWVLTAVSQIRFENEVASSQRE